MGVIFDKWMQLRLKYIQKWGFEPKYCLMKAEIYLDLIRDETIKEAIKYTCLNPHPYVIKGVTVIITEMVENWEMVG